VLEKVPSSRRVREVSRNFTVKSEKHPQPLSKEKP
jgi:hypothetical protein